MSENYTEIKEDKDICINLFGCIVLTLFAVFIIMSLWGWVSALKQK